MVLSATTAQKNQLQGTYARGNQLVFIPDANGNWVVNQSVLTDPDFEQVRDELEALPIVEYEAPPKPQGL